MEDKWHQKKYKTRIKAKVRNTISSNGINNVAKKMQAENEQLQQQVKQNPKLEFGTNISVKLVAPEKILTEN